MKNNGKYIVQFCTVLFFGVVTGIILSQGDEAKIKSKKTVFSIKEQAKNLYIQKEFIEPELLLASQLSDNTHSDIQKNLSADKLRMLYEEKYERNAMEVASSIEQLEDEHYLVLSQMRKEKVKIDSFLSLRPRLRIAVTYFLGLNLGEMTAEDFSKLNLTRREWYIIKTFSESKDFILMLKRQSLNRDFLQINNLEKYYASNF